jgi:predicted Fe-Mo cluster-binding NifX family protein
MIVCVPVYDDGTIDPRWGRADRLAVADVRSGEVVRWDEVEVSWNELHDQGTEGSHHARVVRFLRDHDIAVVVAGHMGDPMVHTLEKMGLQVHLGAAGDARTAVLSATAE